MKLSQKQQDVIDGMDDRGGLWYSMVSHSYFIGELMRPYVPFFTVSESTKNVLSRNKLIQISGREFKHYELTELGRKHLTINKLQQ